MAAGGLLFFKGDQNIGKDIGPLGNRALDARLMAFLAGGGSLSHCGLLPLFMGFAMTGGAQ